MNDSKAVLEQDIYLLQKALDNVDHAITNIQIDIDTYRDKLEYFNDYYYDLRSAFEKLLRTANDFNQEANDFIEEDDEDEDNC